MTDTSCRRFTDDVCIVAGAGRDISRGIAERLAAEGARVVIVEDDVDHGRAVEAAIDDADSPGEAKFVRASLTDEAAVKGVMHAVADEWGGIDGLVNSAVDATNESVLDVSEDELDRVFAATLKSAVFCTKHAAPIMAEGDGGAIVNVAGGHRGVAETVAYCTAASGLLNFTRQTAVDLAEYDVRVNSLSPARFRDAVAHEESAGGDSFSGGDRPGEGNVPGNADAGGALRGRVGEPEDYAAAVAYLLSEDADFVTGIELPVDGGASASF